MEHTVFNPRKGRLETISVNFTTENTTWFTNCAKPGDVEMITDYHNGDLLIKTYGRDYLVRIYETTRVTIGYRQKQAQEVLMKAMQE